MLVIISYSSDWLPNMYMLCVFLRMLDHTVLVQCWFVLHKDVYICNISLKHQTVSLITYVCFVCVHVCMHACQESDTDCLKVHYVCLHIAIYVIMKRDVTLLHVSWESKPVTYVCCKYEQGVVTCVLLFHKVTVLPPMKSWFNFIVFMSAVEKFKLLEVCLV